MLPLGEGAVAATFTDVTDRSAAQGRLRDLADTDAITGLWNHSRFHHELTTRIVSNVPTVVALLDLNDFRQLNDAMGHGAGDRLLEVLGTRLGAQVPADWVVARLGGDQFAAAVPGTRDDAPGIAQRLLRLVSEPVRVEGVRVRPAASVGLACFPDDGHEGQRLLRLADAALQKAKDPAEAYHVCSPAERFERDRRDELSRTLSAGFAKNQFMLYAQPIVDLKRYEIVGAEGLARWVVPETGVLTPNFFLSLLDMVGGTSELTDFMLDQAVGLTSGGRFMSINLSPTDLDRRDLVDSVQRAMAARAPHAGEVWLEIIEERLPAAAPVLIDELISHGVSVAIDDFGAAFSSLTRLADHEISVLKLDRQLLQSLGTNPRARRVVRSVVEASHDLGALVVAEGVETMEAASVVEDLGCDLVQGFLLGRPAPEPMVADLLRNTARLTPDDWPDADAIRAWEASLTA